MVRWWDDEMVRGWWWEMVNEMVDGEMKKREKYISSHLPSHLTYHLISHLTYHLILPCSVGGNLTAEGKTRERDERLWDDEIMIINHLSLSHLQPSHDQPSTISLILTWNTWWYFHLIYHPIRSDEMRWLIVIWWLIVRHMIMWW